MANMVIPWRAWRSLKERFELLLPALLSELHANCDAGLNVNSIPLEEEKVKP